MTRNQLEQARKEAERFGNFVRRVAEVEHAMGVALETYDAVEAFKQEQVVLEIRNAELTAAKVGLEADITALDDKLAQLDATYDAELATQQAALRTRLEAETEAETLRYESTYAGLMADCDAAERLRTELHATIETLEGQITQRQGMLRQLQAQLQAMLAGGTV